MTGNENIVSESVQDEILASILQKISAPPASPSSASASGSGGDILSSLLSNPELIAKLPTIISSIKPVIDILKTSGSTTTSAIPTSAIPSEPDEKEIPAAMVRHAPGADSRTALLCAMKPYLSQDRQNAIDYIVKIGRLGDILKTL